MTRKIFIACGAALACFLSACAVGPNFKKPDPPRTAGFTPSGAIPAQIGASATPGQAQRLVEGLDIQGQWWTLFQSPALNELIERALNNSPTLEAATAALRQARETLAAERGSYYPSLSAAAGVQRQKVPGAAFGASADTVDHLHAQQRDPEHLLHLGSIRRHPPPGRSARRAGRIRAICSGGGVLEPHRQLGHRSHHRSLSAGATCRHRGDRRLAAPTTRYHAAALHAGGASRADMLQQQAVLQAPSPACPPCARSSRSREICWPPTPARCRRITPGPNSRSIH